MSEAKWSPEPWRRGEEHETAIELLSSMPHGVICRVTGSILYPCAPEVQANARRIIACVNACQGLSTEALEAGALAAVIRGAEARAALDRSTQYHRNDDGSVNVVGGWEEWQLTVKVVEAVQDALRALGRLP